MKTKRGLGRGLDTLIQEFPVENAEENKNDAESAGGVTNIPLNKIAQNPYQPRQTFEPEALQDLVQSIQIHGVLQPLLLRRSGDNYELIAGERRLRAARQAGLENVPAIVKSVNDADMLALGLIENLQREDLNVIEEADGYRQLISQFDMTQGDIARVVGKARATVANMLRLLDLPDEIKQMLKDGLLSSGHAKTLVGVALEEEKRLLARRAVKEGLTVRALERIVNNLTRVPRKPRTERSDIPADHIRYLSERLHDHFGSNIRLQPSRTLANGKKAKGSIEINFYSNEDLSRILDILGISKDGEMIENS